MRFTVQTKILKQAIDIVNHASISVGTTPILENILITANYKNVVLTANNLEMAIEYMIDEGVQVETEGAFTISNRFISSYVSLIQEDTITLELDTKNTLVFTTDSSETGFKGLPAKEFPLIPSVQKEKEFQIPAKLLKKAFEKTLFSCAEGTIRPTLAGVFVRVDNEKITFASTDSFRLSEFQAKNSVDIESPFSIIVPARTIQELTKILSSDSDEMVKISVSENQFLAVFGGIRVFSRLLNGHFPDYGNFFPKGYSTQAVVRSSELKNTLKQINIISKEVNYNTRMLFDENGLEVTTGDTEIGAGKITIKADTEGNIDRIGFNSTYLLQALTVIGTEYIKINFETNLSPILIQSVDNGADDAEQFKHIIMPLKI